MKNGGTLQSSIEFWLHEWRVHGIYSGMGVREYFEKVRQLYQRIPGTQVLHPLGVPQSLNSLQLRIRNSINAQVHVRGFRHGRGRARRIHLLEVFFEMDPQTLRFVNTPTGYLFWSYGSESIRGQCTSENCNSFSSGCLASCSDAKVLKEDRAPDACIERCKLTGQKRLHFGGEKKNWKSSFFLLSLFILDGRFWGKIFRFIYFHPFFYYRILGSDFHLSLLWFRELAVAIWMFS